VFGDVFGGVFGGVFGAAVWLVQRCGCGGGDACPNGARGKCGWLLSSTLCP